MGFYALDRKKVVFIADIQEVLVKRENTPRMDPSPNPYNPDDYPLTDKSMKLSLKKSTRLNATKQKFPYSSRRDLCSLRTILRPRSGNGRNRLYHSKGC